MSLSGHFKDKQQWKLKTKERRDISKEEDAERERSGLKLAHCGHSLQHGLD